MTGYIITQMRFTGVPDERIERFVRTVVRDTLGEVPPEGIFRSPNGRSPAAMSRGPRRELTENAISMKMGGGIIFQHPFNERSGYKVHQHNLRIGDM